MTERVTDLSADKGEPTMAQYDLLVEARAVSALQACSTTSAVCNMEVGGEWRVLNKRRAPEWGSAVCRCAWGKK